MRRDIMSRIATLALAAVAAKRLSYPLPVRGLAATGFVGRVSFLYLCIPESAVRDGKRRTGAGGG